jgi:hypothetical protein
MARGVYYFWLMNIGGQFHSISHSGMRIFDRPIESTVGGLVVDLASAQLAPGEHRMQIDAGVGGIEIYLPKYVTFTVEGGPTFGGYDVHDGPGLWTKLMHKLGLSKDIPAEAAPAPSEPVAVHFVIDGVIGGVDVYRV